MSNTNSEALDELNKIEKEFLCEMAIINPQKCKHLTIQVEVEQRDEGPIPHLHCYHNKTRSSYECSYIRLDKCEYSSHHGKNKSILTLNKNKKDEFVSLMNEPCGNYMKCNDDTFVELTGYQDAVRIWVETFEDGSYAKFELDEKGVPVQIDYSKL